MKILSVDNINKNVYDDIAKIKVGFEILKVDF